MKKTCTYSFYDGIRPFVYSGVISKGCRVRVWSNLLLGAIEDAANYAHEAVRANLAGTRNVVPILGIQIPNPLIVCWRIGVEVCFGGMIG